MIHTHYEVTVRKFKWNMSHAAHLLKDITINKYSPKVSGFPKDLLTKMLLHTKTVAETSSFICTTKNDGQAKISSSLENFGLVNTTYFWGIYIYTYYMILFLRTSYKTQYVYDINFQLTIKLGLDGQSGKNSEWPSN